MYLVEVVPLTKIPIQKPQVLSYFSTHQAIVGSLILVPLGRRQAEAVVIETHQIKDHKLEIKEAGYELRPIKKIMNPEAVLTRQQIKLALWLSQYYFISPGLFAKMMAPKKTRFRTTPNSWLPASRHDTEQKLILIPEVSQIKSIQKYFPKNKTVIIQSALKAKQFYESWQKIARGQAEIIIGTRLSAFAPFVNLKEIIIEDEINPHHRSWDMFPNYRTHEVAQELAELFDAKLILKSSLPSVESYYSGNVQRPAYDFASQKIKTEIIDLRQELKKGNYSIFSQELEKAITNLLQKKQQVILFINRRGLATFVLCRDCGYVAKCPNCDAPLTYHLIRSADSGANNLLGLKPALICHHCGFNSFPPSLCPKCQSHRIKAFGTGTQRVEMEAQKLFKEARIIRLDSDVAKNPAKQNQLLQRFKEKKADILIGTQIILNEFLPKVPLVAIISSDTLMHLPDFRSDERLYQTINQLKKFTNARLIIQTYNPQGSTIILAAKNDFKSFYQQEVETRKILKYPPFSQLIKLIFRHKDPKKAAAEAKILFAKLTQQLNSSKIFKEVILELIGPAPAFISKEKQKYIWQIIIKAKPIWLAAENERQNLINIRNKFLMTAPSYWEIDIDPESLL